MVAKVRQFSRLAPIILTVVLLGAACGDSSAPAVPKLDLANVKCEEKPAAGLGEGAVCVDTGIRSQSLFSFANWGGRRYKSDDFGFTEMIALYGESNVCSKVGATKCDVTPKARLIRDVINGLLQNGRCEGLSALGALYMTSRGPAPVTFGAGSVQELTPSVDSFADVIDYWWATQFMENVLNASKASRGADVESVLKTVIDGLATGKGVTLGLYAKEGAHSVLPVAVTRTEANLYVVHVWDSNNPRALGRVSVDTASGTWKYRGGRVNNGATATDWTGGKGTIDVVALDARNGKPTLDISSKGRGTAKLAASTSSNADVSLTVVAADGSKLTATSSGTTGAIPGVEATSLRTGDTNQVLVMVPGLLNGYSITMAVSGASDGTSQLTVDTGTSRSLAVSVPAVKDGSTAMVDIAGTSDAPEFSVSSPRPVSVSASTDTSVLSIPLGAGDDLSIKGSERPGVDSMVTIDPRIGKSMDVDVAMPASGTTQEVVLARSVDGSLVLLPTPLTSVPINREILATLADVSTQKDDQSTGVATQDTPASATVVDVAGSSLEVADTSAVVLARVSSDVAVKSAVEYGPNSDWSSITRTEIAAVDPGTGVESSFQLRKLTPGTEYRYRIAVDVSGFKVFSAWNTFVTSGEAPDEFATFVSAAGMKVATALVAATATGGVLTSKVTSPVASSLWVEYALESNPTQVVETVPQNVRKGDGSTVVSVLNGLTMGQTYRYRVVLQARGVRAYAPAAQFTTGVTVATERLPVLNVLPEFTFTIGDVTQTTADVRVIVTGTSAGKVQVETAENGLTNPVRSRVQSFVAGKSVEVVVPVAGLKPSTLYNFRVLISAGTLTGRSGYRQATTLALVSGDTSGGRLDPPVVAASRLTTTTAGFVVVARPESDGQVFFEYGIDNPSGLLYATAKVNVPAGNSTVGPVDSDSVMSAGTPYRVRAVLIIGEQSYRSAFVSFSTAGTLDYSAYTAQNLSLRRSATGVDAAWSIRSPEIPSAITFKLLDGTTVICSASATLSCGGAVNAFGNRIMTIATFLNGTEITRGDSAQISIGGTPTVSAFTVVTQSSASVTVQYSFDPQGETVQYGIEVRTAADQFVKADLGGSTGSARNGAVQVITGLMPSTTYKIRLVLLYGSNTKASDWVTVSTTA